jgi:AraC-like DNA-binding protein
MADSVLSVGCRVLLAACDQLGLDTDALTRSAAIDRRVIDDPDGRLPPEQVQALWEAAYRQSSTPHLALRAAQAIPLGAYRVLEYLVASAPTVGAAFSKISEYFAWIDTSARLPVEREATNYALGISVKGPPDCVPLAAVEFTFATCLLKVRALTHQDFKPIAIDAALTLPEGAKVLEDFFGCPVRFSARHNRMLFDAATWALPSQHADPSLLSVLEGHAKLLIAAIDSEPRLVAEVRQALYTYGPSQSLSTVAKQLGMSARTLQRRLTDAGFLFADVANAVREDVARRLLRERNVAIAEAALVLGFSDQSSFTRSFKRWTGTTPAAFRQAAVSENSH